METTMRAATNTRYGAPEVLKVTRVERPRVGPKQILVEVHASAVTQGDRHLRAADFPGISALFGRLLFGLRAPRNPIGGSAFAGRVVGVGADVTRFAVGDDVFGSLVKGGGYGEYLVAKEDEPIARMPSRMSHSEAAALPYGALTALAFLRDQVKVQPGERVLVVGATGGVGRPAVQIAKHLGAHVTAVGHRGLAELLALGADALVDYREEEFLARGETWDVILDTTEGDNFRRFRPALTPEGRYISVYITPRLLWDMATSALTGGPRAMAGIAMGSPAELDDVRQIAEAGALLEPLAARFPLERVVAAHRALEDERPFGSIVVELREGAAADARVA